MIDNLINTTWIVFGFSLFIVCIFTYGYIDEIREGKGNFKMPSPYNIWFNIMQFSTLALPVLYIVRIWL